MEKENVEKNVSDAEFKRLLILSKEGNNEALNKLLILYYEDIIKLSKYIRLPYEDAVQSILTDFIELIKEK